MRLARSAVVLALALLVGTCAACGTAPPSKEALSPSQLVLQLEQRSVALVQPRANGLRPYCSGVWVSANDILTANHCVADLDLRDTVAYATRADEASGNVRVGVLVVRDEDHDLALVRDGAAPAHGVAKISSPYVGQNAHSMGHPLGLWWSYSLGQVAAIRFKALGGDEAMWWVQATTPISSGNSGGGLFDDDGNLIGLADASANGGQNLNFFVHPKYVGALLGAQAIK